MLISRDEAYLRTENLNVSGKESSDGEITTLKSVGSPRAVTLRVH